MIVKVRHEGDVIPQGLSITILPEHFHVFRYRLSYAEYVRIRHGDYIMTIRIPHDDPKNYTIEETNGDQP